MFINKEGKLFGKISIIDIFVVLAVAILAFGLYTRFYGEETKVSTQKQQIEYTVLVKGVRLGTIEALQQKGPITNTTTKEEAGEITDVTFEEAVDTRELSNGKIAETALPERYTATVKICVDGSVNNSGYYTSTNQPINIGSTLFFTSKFANTSGVIIDVNEVQ
jgi:hypothetical protein